MASQVDIEDKKFWKSRNALGTYQHGAGEREGLVIPQAYEKKAFRAL